MARDKVKGADPQAADKHPDDQPNPSPDAGADPGGDEPADSAESPDPADSADSPDPVAPTASEKAKPARRSGSGTAAAAARHRAVMQRRHLRLGFAMTAAIGIELAAVAGLVAGSLLAWEWGERLWGRTEPVWLVLQVALGATVLLLGAAWLIRGDRGRAQLRVAGLVGGAGVAVISFGLVWQAEPAAAGVGPVVATIGGVLAIVGAAIWLLSLRRLLVLFPFGLADARSRGFGNLPAVQRARFAGGPVGALSGAALVTGALLLGAGWVSTVDATTAEPLALPDEPATVAGGPSWTLQLAATEEGPSAQVWSTPGGLVIEELTGVRAVDPRTGQTHWHWRDTAYQRTAGVLTDGGQTVVLAMTYEGEASGRDRVVALDTDTGEQRWERFDDDLVAAMGTIVVASEAGDWFVVPEQEQSPTVDAQAQLGLRAVEGASGQTRWRAGEDAGCSFTAVTGDADGAVVTTQQCAPSNGESEAGAPPSCRVTGLDPATGEPSWVWPAPDPAEGDAPATECQVTATPDQVQVSYQSPEGQQALGLDPGTGEQLWQAGPDEDLGGLRGPVQVGDALAGAEWVDDGLGGGQGELVIRDFATGEVRERVALPAGQPIETAAQGSGQVAITHYRPDTTEVVLLVVDIVAAELLSETVVAAPASPEAQLRRVTLTAGPTALAVETLVASSADPATAEFTMNVYGW